METANAGRGSSGRIPVSYTHLDVYKRQAYLLFVCFVVFSGALPVGPFPAKPIGVMGPDLPETTGKCSSMSVFMVRGSSVMGVIDPAASETWVFLQKDMPAVAGVV